MAYGKELSVETRVRILELHDIGWSMQKIATKHSLAKSTVQYTITKARERAGASVNCSQASLPRTGTPRVITEDERDAITETIEKNPYVTHEELRKEHVPHSSVRTMQRLCNEMERRKWMCLRRPALTEEHAVTRLR